MVQGKGDNSAGENGFDRLDKNASRQVEQGAVNAFRDEFHLSQKDATKLVKDIERDDRKVEHLSHDEIIQQVAQIQSSLDKMGQFLFTPDPQTNTSFFDRLQKHDSGLAKSLMDSFHGTDAGNYVLQYQAELNGNQNPQQVHTLMAKFQTIGDKP